jgi:2-oxoglutarate ferredoxin oxidoreductase subunit alpha
MTTTTASRTASPQKAGPASSKAQTKTCVTLKEHIVEIISDSGEGAQRCGQSLGSIAARMGNGVWTTEIIPAEIRPPARSVAGASGIRIRIGSSYVTNGGDETDLVVAFNEQVLLGRVNARELKPGCIILLENMWRTHSDPNTVKSYSEAYDRLVKADFKVYEIPMEEECLKFTTNARRGKNMFALGILCHIYNFDLQAGREQIALTFGKKEQSVIDANVVLLEAGHQWARANIGFSFHIPATPTGKPQISINGNVSLALGVMASGMDICAMYPITPATSASHYLSEAFEKVGGIVHQAEDEIAACAFAIGASYAGKCALTITSGPGYSLKQEGIGLAVMAEIPLVVVNVQRGQALSACGANSASSAWPGLGWRMKASPTRKALTPLPRIRATSSTVRMPLSVTTVRPAGMRGSRPSVVCRETSKLRRSRLLMPRSGVASCRAQSSSLASWTSARTAMPNPWARASRSRMSAGSSAATISRMASAPIARASKT